MNVSQFDLFKIHWNPNIKVYVWFAGYFIPSIDFTIKSSSWNNLWTVVDHVGRTYKHLVSFLDVFSQYTQCLVYCNLSLFDVRSRPRNMITFSKLECLTVFWLVLSICIFYYVWKVYRYPHTRYIIQMWNCLHGRKLALFGMNHMVK